MTTRFVLLAPVLLLFGCASDERIFEGRNLTVESEECRAVAFETVEAPGTVKESRANEKAAAFDRAYRDCLADRGYQLSAQ